MSGNQVSEQQAGWDIFLVEILREEIASRDAELDALRGSLRFQVGSWALEAFPPGRGTIVFFVRLLRLFLRRRTKRPVAAASNNHPGLNAMMTKASVVVFGHSIPPDIKADNIWLTQDADLVANRLDMKAGEPGLLIIRSLSEKILRRLERARRARWRVVWQPEDETSALDPALAAYIHAHVDDMQDMG